MKGYANCNRMEHLQKFVLSTRCKKTNNKKSFQTYFGMVSKPINLFHWSFLQVLRLVILMSFDLSEWKLCFVSMNVVMG
jgi:hypothetical protein